MSLVGVLSAPLIADSALRALYVVLRLGRRAVRSSEPPAETPSSRLAVTILAHDEQAVIGATVRRTRASDYPADCFAVFVVADNCTDATAETARAAGAEVWERFEPTQRGKAAALGWFLEQADASLGAYDALVVLDADSQIAPDCLAHLAQALAGSAVVQGFIQPIHADGAVVASLAAYSEILSQAIDDVARTGLGWPVPLRGTGMALPPRLLGQFTRRLHTRAEDTELSVLLAEHGIPIGFAPRAIVGDPKPIDAGRAARQRARWLQGRVEVLRQYRGTLLRLLTSGRPGDAALALTLGLRPKTLVLATKLLAGGLLLHPPGVTRRLRILGAALLVAGGIDLGYFLVGLAVVDRPAAYARALLRAPAYFLMWGRGIATALMSREAWLSARRSG